MNTRKPARLALRSSALKSDRPMDPPLAITAAAMVQVGSQRGLDRLGLLLTADRDSSTSRDPLSDVLILFGLGRGA